MKKNLLDVDLDDWEKGVWKQAFEIAKGRGSCKINGSSYLNILEKLEDKLIGFYVYDGNLYSITPISPGEYGGWGEQNIKLVDKSKILAKLNNLIEKLS